MEVSVEKAIKKGEFWLLAVPMYLGAAGILLSIMNWKASDQSVWMKVADTVFILLIPALIFRSFAATRWKLWAYEKVRNVRELQRKALNEGIIFPEDSWLSRLEFRTQSQKEKMRRLREKFALPDDRDYKDLYPAVLSVRKSRMKIFKAAATFIFINGLGIFMFIRESYVIALILTGTALFLLYLDRRILTDGPVPLRIDAKGIFLGRFGFTPWENIRSEEVKTIDTGKGATHWLEFYRSEETAGSDRVEAETEEDDAEDEMYLPEGEHVSYELSYLDIEAEELGKVLKVYRKRSGTGERGQGLGDRG